jgi:hypothetical protein
VTCCSALVATVWHWVIAAQGERLSTRRGVGAWPWASAGGGGGGGAGLRRRAGDMEVGGALGVLGFGAHSTLVATV